VRNRLTVRWSVARVERVWSIRTENDAYTNPVTMSFDLNRPLSLVAYDVTIHVRRAAEVSRAFR
jgi:hypothetical protein